MIPKRRGALHRRARFIMLSFIIFCCALVPYASFAGKEGIYISGSSYFTMEKVRFSEGSDDAILRFSIALHNGDKSSIDYNQYGVRVTDAGGISYTAQLTGQQNARVQPGKEQQFAYEARVAKGLKADQLQVTLFTWNFGTTVSMNDLGSFSVAAAMEYAADSAPEAIVPLKKIDSTLSNDDKVSFRVGNEYFVYENNDWTMYTDLLAENVGDSGLTLPAGLKMRLEDSGGQIVTVTTVDGADKSLLPGKPQRVTVRAAIPSAESAGDWTLQFYYTSGTTTTVLDSLPVGQSSTISTIGDARSITDGSGQETVAVKLESAVITQSEAGQSVSAKVRIINNGAKVVAIPKLTVKIQTEGGGVSVAAADDGSAHPAYLSQSESETFTYTALMPKGVAVSDLQIALFESRNAGTTTTTTTTTTATTNTTAKTVPVLVAGLSNAQINDLGSGSGYEIGSSLNLALDKKIDVALSELRLYDNDSNGFKTAVAKMKFTNLDSSVLATPDLAFELVDNSGHIYSGTKQATAATQLATNSSYLISYSFLMSSVDTSKPLLLRAYNAKDVNKVPLGIVQVAFQQDNLEDDYWDAFPYQITLNSKMLLHSVLSTTFSYTFRMDIDVKRTEQIIADAALSKLQFELVDAFEQVISTQTIPFLGNVKLVNGTNEMTFTNLKVNQYSSKNYINLYEIIDTPNGVVRRKLMEFH